MGFAGGGWDPTHRPNEALNPAPVVNLGYVVNVIEDPRERQTTLERAWALAERVLIVSARLTVEAQTLSAASGYADGYLTSRGTFQKFFEQDELKDWIGNALGVSPLPAGPGVFYVFRDEHVRSAFMASRFRRQIVVPRSSVRSSCLNNTRKSYGHWSTFSQPAAVYHQTLKSPILPRFVTYSAVSSEHFTLSNAPPMRQLGGRLPTNELKIC